MLNAHTKQDIAQICMQAAEVYNKYLNNKNILIIDKNNTQLNFFEVKFNPSNFLHYTGVSTKLNAYRFFQRALDKRLSPNDFEIYNDFLINKKMDVLYAAMFFPTNARIIGEHNAPKIKLKADIGAGSTNYVLTFRYVNKNKSEHILHPVGLNKEDVRDTTNPKFPIVAILSKSNNEKVYDEITYISKNIKLDNLFIPKELMSLLSDKALSEIKPNIVHKQKTISTTNKATIHQQSKPEIVSIDDFDFIGAEEIAATSENVAKSSGKEQIKSLKDIIHFFSGKNNKDKTPKIDKSTQSLLEPKQERVSMENKRSGYSSFPTVNRPSDTKDTQSKERKKDNPSL